MSPVEGNVTGILPELPCEFLNKNSKGLCNGYIVLMTVRIKIEKGKSIKVAACSINNLEKPSSCCCSVCSCNTLANLIKIISSYQGKK